MCTAKSAKLRLLAELKTLLQHIFQSNKLNLKKNYNGKTPSNYFYFINHADGFMSISLRYFTYSMLLVLISCAVYQMMISALKVRQTFVYLNLYIRLWRTLAMLTDSIHNISVQAVFLMILSTAYLCIVHYK